MELGRQMIVYLLKDIAPKSSPSFDFGAFFLNVMGSKELAFQVIGRLKN